MKSTTLVLRGRQGLLLVFLFVCSIARIELLPITIRFAQTNLHRVPESRDLLTDFQYRVPLLGVCALLLGFEWIPVFWFAYNRQPGLASRWATPVYIVLSIAVNILWFLTLLKIGRYWGNDYDGIMYSGPCPSTTSTFTPPPDEAGTPEPGTCIIWTEHWIYHSEVFNLSVAIICLATITLITTGFVYFRAFRLKPAMAFYEPISTAAEQDQTNNSNENPMPTVEGQCARAYRLGPQEPVRTGVLQVVTVCMSIYLYLERY